MANEQQQLIIESNSKRIVVLACPGSGKTTTIVNKIVSLRNKGVSLKRILSVTFTRKAAQEMYERIAKEVPVSKSEQRNICTLHSFGCRILFSYKDVVGLKEEYSVAIRSEKEKIVKEIVGEVNYTDELCSLFLDYVSCVKNGVSEEMYGFTTEQFDKYQSKMIENNLIDLDDYIYLTVKILKKNELIRNRISSKYNYIYVDEYQDINKIQNELLDLLINDNTNVLYVGDDDQSIYEFRGSNPNYILEKSSSKSDYDVYFLTTNYRSQKPIVEFSKKVLSSLLTNNRREKEIIAYKNSSDIKPIRHSPFPTKEAEIEYVSNEIYRLITESNVEPEEIAVLCRFSSKKNSAGIITHPELYEIGNRLRAKGISATSSIKMECDGTSSKYIKELCQTLVLLNEGSYNPDVCNLIRPNSYKKDRFITLIEKINSDNGNINIDVSLPFCEIMDMLIQNEVTLTDSSWQKRLDILRATYLFTKSQYDLVQDGAMPSEILANISNYFIKNSNNYDAVKDIYEYALLFLKSAENEWEPEQEGESAYLSVVKAMEVYLYEQDKNASKHSVKLLTAHQSKGLQFDVVFVVGLEAGSFPCNIEILDDQNLDNERRLFYVCVTRARELLYLSSHGYAVDDNKELADKSFIYNLPSKYFDDVIKTFDNITFTQNEINSFKRSIDANEEIINQDEYEKSVLSAKLKEANNNIKLLKSKLSSNIDSSEKDKLMLRINNFEKNIQLLLQEIKDKDDYAVSLRNKISSLEQEKRELGSQLKQSNLSQNELNHLENENDILKSQLTELNNRLSLAEKRNAQIAKEASDYRERIEKVESVKEMSGMLNEMAPVLNNAKTTVSFVYNQLLGESSEYLSDSKKDVISKLYKIFIVDKKYYQLSVYFESGVSNLLNLLDIGQKYKNNACDREVFRSRVFAYSYKTDMAVLLKRMLEVQSNSSFVIRNSKEFSTFAFVEELLKGDPGFDNYGKLVRNYMTNTRKKPEKFLIQNMAIMLALSSISSHDYTKKAVRPFERKYQDITNAFLNTAKETFVDVFFSLFEYVSMFIDDDSLMLHVKIK